MTYEGGCRCGAIRYRVTGDPLSAGYCHCRMCQRAAATPVVAWVAFRRDDFHIVKGEAEAVRASTRATRRFCRECGSALTFEYSASIQTIDVNLASLDDPTAADPVYQFWIGERPQWRHRADGDPPDTPPIH